MNINTKKSLINIGTGKDFTITQYAKQISKIIGIEAKIQYDKSKPNGTKRKVLDISIAKKFGWKPKINLKNGIILAYKSFINSK